MAQLAEDDFPPRRGRLSYLLSTKGGARFLRWKMCNDVSVETCERDMCGGVLWIVPKLMIWGGRRGGRHCLILTGRHFDHSALNEQPFGFFGFLWLPVGGVGKLSSRFSAGKVYSAKPRRWGFYRDRVHG